MSEAIEKVRAELQEVIERAGWILQGLSSPQAVPQTLTALTENVNDSAAQIRQASEAAGTEPDPRFRGDVSFYVTLPARLVDAVHHLVKRDAIQVDLDKAEPEAAEQLFRFLGGLVEIRPQLMERMRESLIRARHTLLRLNLKP